MTHNRILAACRRMLGSRRGVTAIEYGVILALILGVIIVGVTSTGVNLRNIFCGFWKALSASSAPAFTAFDLNTASAYFATASGEQITPYSFGSESPVPTTTAQLQSFYDYLDIIKSTSGSPISVPAYNGSSAGQINVPAGFLARISQKSGALLYGSSSGPNVVWDVSSPTNTLTTAQTTSLSNSCTSIGGTTATSSSYVVCESPAAYPSNLGSLFPGV
jgi:Flp pilus assembly pilin Flp